MIRKRELSLSFSFFLSAHDGQEQSGRSAQAAVWFHRLRLCFRLQGSTPYKTHKIHIFPADFQAEKVTFDLEKMWRVFAPSSGLMALNIGVNFILVE